MAIVLTMLLYVDQLFRAETRRLVVGRHGGLLVGPMAVIVLSPIFRHSLFHAMYVFPFMPHERLLAFRRLLDADVQVDVRRRLVGLRL